MNALKQEILAVLPESNKALRLRVFDRATKSKVIVDVQWYWVGSNKAPHITTDLIQVKKDGVILDHTLSHSERTKIACEIAPEFAPFLNSHLVNWNSNGSDANGIYYAKQTIKHCVEHEGTKEELTAHRDQVWADLWGCKFGQQLTKVINLQDTIKKSFDCMFGVHNLDNTKSQIIKNWEKWTRDPSWTKKPQNIKTWITKLESAHNRYRHFNKLASDATPAADVWTVQRLSSYTGIDVNELAFLLLGDFDTLESRLRDEGLVQIEQLKRLSIKLQIPLVITK